MSSQTRLSGALAPQTLRYACLDDLSDLRDFFRKRELPFDLSLVREKDGLLCHIFLEPTIPGFRADPDNWPVTGIYGDIDTLSFLALRDKPLGDSLDVLKSILPQLKTPLEVTIGVVKSHEEPWYEEAQDFHFPESSHEIRLENNPGMDGTNPWAQDYLKSGDAGGKRRILVTRSIVKASWKMDFVINA